MARMMAENTIDSRVVTETEAYLADITACVDLIPKLLDDYIENRAYRETADEIRTCESKCDTTNRQISALITNATVDEIGLRNTRIHMNSTQIVTLYQIIDEIANIAEEIADELLTIAPPPDDTYFRQYGEMAECAISAMSALKQAVTTFFQLLTTPSESGSITEEIQTVRAAESSSDELRNDLIARAFSDDSLSEPWVYHRFAHLFDELVDAIEDVTDHLVIISSNEEWLTTDV